MKSLLACSSSFYINVHQVFTSISVCSNSSLFSLSISLISSITPLSSPLFSFLLKSKYFNFCIIRVLFFFLSGSCATKLRVLKLCRDPNAMATTVQAKHMTLYGMLKSGVGRDTTRLSVWSLRKNLIEASFILKKKKKKKMCITVAKLS